MPFATASFSVGGLFDSQNQAEIKDVLQDIDGVQKVNVDLQEKRVDVTFDSTVLPADYLARTLNSLGYSPYVDIEQQGGGC
nr:heavy-metal-associated domain-containing protein [Desulfurispora thermophila]